MSVPRQATRADIPGMHRVRLAVRENRLTPGAIAEEHYIPEIETTGRGWVVVEGGEVVAFAVGNRETRNIWALFVDPAYERRGHGRRLHAAMVEWLFAQGVPRIWLSTEPGTRAQKFYEAAGWRFVRVLPSGERYYELDRRGGLPAILRDNLALPVIGAPMFIVSRPELVIAQCTAGIVGSFPALNARPAEELDRWLAQIGGALTDYQAANPQARVAPFAVNQIVHASNDRLAHDVELCVKHRVPIVITSLRAPGEVVSAIHSYGGLVFHDVINVRHAKKALDAGVDGLILVCAGAGGHAGTLSPFALVAEVRRFFAGPIILSGAITRGEHVLAAQAMGADLAYIGTRFIATTEANAPDGYKEMIVGSSAADIVYSDYFSGVMGNYLRGSIVAAGLDPENLPAGDKSKMKFGGPEGSAKAKAWRDIWGAGQGVGSIDQVLPAREVVEQLSREYEAARTEISK